MIVNLNDVLSKAKAEHYAVGLFNTHDTDMLEAAISAAEELRSPIIIGTAEVLLPYGDLPLIAPALVAAAKAASVPVVATKSASLGLMASSPRPPSFPKPTAPSVSAARTRSQPLA